MSHSSSSIAVPSTSTASSLAIENATHVLRGTGFAAKKPALSPLEVALVHPDALKVLAAVYSICVDRARYQFERYPSSVANYKSSSWITKIFKVHPTEPIPSYEQFAPWGDLESILGDDKRSFRGLARDLAKSGLLEELFNHNDPSFICVSVGLRIRRCHWDAAETALAKLAESTPQ